MAKTKEDFCTNILIAMTTLHVNLGVKKHGRVINIEKISDDPFANVKIHMLNDTTDIIACAIVSKCLDLFNEYNYEHHVVVERESQIFKFIIVPHQLWNYLCKFAVKNDVGVIALHITEDDSKNFRCTTGNYDGEDIRSVEIPVHEFCKSVPLITFTNVKVLNTPRDPLVTYHCITVKGTATSCGIAALEQLSDDSNGAIRVLSSNAPTE